MPINISFIKQRATELGFTAIGSMRPRPSPHYGSFIEWLAGESYGELSWLKKNVELRKDPGRLLEGCRTVISLAMAYPAEQARTPDGFTVARYASSPIDYHEKLKSRCRELADMIRNAFPGSKSRVFVDSAPILERSIASGAGVGFIGKNNMLIVPGIGSYVNLAEILTTAPLDPDVCDPLECRCGDCRLCIEACPTGALERPFLLNAEKCLAYLTVEYRGELQEGCGMAMGRCFVGCDRCQEVCPFNEYRKAELLSLPSTEEFINMDEQTFSGKFGRTALARPGLSRLKRNIQAIGRNPV